MGYAYRYVDARSRPALTCPECGMRWGGHRGVVIEAIVGDQLVELASRLDADGRLEDVAGLVAGGHHGGTRCSDCGERLIDLPGVEEVQDEAGSL